MWKEQYVPNRRRVSKYHHQPVDANTYTGRWRHPKFKCTNVIVIKRHSFIVPGLPIFCLYAKTFSLIFRIVQLGESVGNLSTHDKKLESISQEWVIVVLA